MADKRSYCKSGILLVLWLLGCAAIYSNSVIAANALKSHSDPLLKIKFIYPETFLIGRYKKEVLPKGMEERGFESPFAKAIVLIEPKQLRKFSLKAIPVGEVPIISLNLLKGMRSSFTKKQLFKEKYKITIGKHTVYRLPGFPGPYGDQVFYYLLPTPNNNVLEIMAHRYYFRDGPPGQSQIKDLPRTEYNRIIERMIQSIKFI